MVALVSQDVDVDDNVQGQIWSVKDLDKLAKLIAVIALGQAQHAAWIIQELEPYGPAISDVNLYIGAKGQIRIRGDTEKNVKYLAIIVMAFFLSAYPGSRLDNRQVLAPISKIYISVQRHRGLMAYQLKCIRKNNVL